MGKLLKFLGKTALNTFPGETDFNWGPVQALHEVGPYLIVEYLDDCSKFSVRDQEDMIDRHGRTLFHPYIKQENGTWRDAHCGYETLEGALFGAICHRIDGPNTRAPELFLNAIAPTREGVTYATVDPKKYEYLHDRIPRLAKEKVEA